MEIDLNEIEKRAQAALEYSAEWFSAQSLNTKDIDEEDASLIECMTPAVLLELVRRLQAAEAEAIKSERRAIEFSDIIHRHILAMRAAVVAAHLEGLDHGMQWIYNTLLGPGHLPDIAEARTKGGAQALFDAELAEHEAFRAAHPAPSMQSSKGHES